MCEGARAPPDFCFSFVNSKPMETAISIVIWTSSNTCSNVGWNSRTCHFPSTVYFRSQPALFILFFYLHFRGVFSVLLFHQIVIDTNANNGVRFWDQFPDRSTYNRRNQRNGFHSASFLSNTPCAPPPHYPNAQCWLTHPSAEGLFDSTSYHVVYRTRPSPRRRGKSS